ncbi:hypothetical protein DCCM_0562 [Desulfocucumis palustris]|uniref:AAA+ ATPase domain-containing protein n=1 Tax=Desulfocucumis palustris TaxID=1898651 RepID=A0A2L2X8D7_9FIRM|nr:ATP-binding protein [Desulfocucumis palustris]GBF32368.1 hypothetical protein DCCM_0562 [Desulfocucumis palustris]
MFNNPNRSELKRLMYLPDSLVIYRKLADTRMLLSLKDLLAGLAEREPVADDIFRKYHIFCALALENSWPECIPDMVLDDENPFSRLASTGGPEAVGQRLKDLADRDLVILQELAGIDSRQLKSIASEIISSTPPDPESWPGWENAFAEGCAEAGEKKHVPGTAGLWLEERRREARASFENASCWGDAVDILAEYYNLAGCGIFSRYPAFRWQKQPAGGELRGIPHPDPVLLEQLIGLSAEHQIILDNTERFLKNLPANNMILYGDRGSGKSSTVKALLHAYAPRGLRMVEIAKPDLGDLPALMRMLSVPKHKFIILIDDLSFEEAELEYKTLKAVLEGGLEARPDNILVYVTSNRHHLVKETFSERQGNDVHAGDAMQEKLSLADRFGITVIFSNPDQKGYLKIVEELAAQRGLEVKPEELRRLALHWEMWHNGRSGRTARQFVDHLEAGLSMEGKIEL